MGLEPVHIQAQVRQTEKLKSIFRFAAERYKCKKMS